MKAADYFLRVVTVAAFIALIVSPEKWGFRLLLFTFATVGIWGVFYPQGIIGWARTAYPQLDRDDPSIWWIPRIIGGVFVIMAILIALAFNWR